MTNDGEKLCESTNYKKVMLQQKQELILDKRQEMLDLIDKESHKYRHINPYVEMDEEGNVLGCCVNGLMMLNMGWKPMPVDGGGYSWRSHIGDISWNDCENAINKRYGENTMTQINSINARSLGWESVRSLLQKAWPGTR
jgi:hypothetical protein